MQPKLPQCKATKLPLPPKPTSRPLWPLTSLRALHANFTLLRGCRPEVISVPLLELPVLGLSLGPPIKRLLDSLEILITLLAPRNLNHNPINCLSIHRGLDLRHPVRNIRAREVRADKEFWLVIHPCENHSTILDIRGLEGGRCSGVHGAKWYLYSFDLGFFSASGEGVEEVASMVARSVFLHSRVVVAGMGHVAFMLLVQVPLIGLFYRLSAGMSSAYANPDKKSGDG